MKVFICIHCEGSQKYLSNLQKAKCPKCKKQLKRIGEKTFIGFSGTQEQGKSAEYIKL